MALEPNTLEQINIEIIACTKCPRLVAWREQVAREKRRAYQDWDYWGKPVPGFGDAGARVLVVGLAPGAHGANRTGRIFTGDGSGDFLYRALHKAGFANQPHARQRGDGLALNDMYISAICRCAPPQNKPTSQEMAACLPYLSQEIDLLPNLQGIVLLGRIAFENTMLLYRMRGYHIPPQKFEHAGIYQSARDVPWMVASYHPSRQNTQTGRLTVDMFDQIWSLVTNFLRQRKPCQDVEAA